MSGNILIIYFTGEFYNIDVSFYSRGMSVRKKGKNTLKSFQ